MPQHRPPGRQPPAWGPAVAALDQVMDTVTRAAVAVDHGAPAPSAGEGRQLTSALDQIAGAVRSGTRPPAQAHLLGEADLTQDKTLTPVADAVRSVQALGASE